MLRIGNALMPIRIRIRLSISMLIQIQIRIGIRPDAMLRIPWIRIRIRNPAYREGTAKSVRKSEHLLCK
jgi:hypothetical protein